MAVCICMLAMTVLMMAYMDNVGLISRKSAVGQLARKYSLRMETGRELLLWELESIGVTEISLEGTSGQVRYGEPIELRICGKLEEEYEFEEKRVSTAKN